MKHLLFSVTLDDCEVKDMTAGGPGGQHQNRCHSAIRIKHLASGAVGVSREMKSQKENKRRAFERMANSKTFQQWCRLEAARRMGQETPEQAVERLMDLRYIKVDVKDEQGRWRPEAATASNRDSG